MPPPALLVDRDPASLTVTELVELIQFCDVAYHTNGASPVSDQAYDALKDRLRSLAPDAAVLQQIGAAPGLGDKVAHPTAMLSLDKCTTATEFWAWYRGNLAQLTDKPNNAKLDAAAQAWAAQPEGQLVVTPKIDGLACALRYDGAGQLAVAATRGDGQIGEDVTENAKRIGDMVVRLPTGGPVHGPIEVRGEVYLALSRFAAVADQFANPRNLAAGVLKAKEADTFAADNLTFFAYDILGPGAAGLTTETAKMAALRALGFAAPQFVGCSAAEAEAIFARFADGRASDDFESDGIVLRLDDVGVAQRLGVTSHHPRGAIAWKYAASADVTVLQTVHWSVARTGTITPVAMVAPVKLSGATVSRATLHNVSNLLRLALRPGDRIEVVRRGGVIPHVERVVTPSAAEPCLPPEHCPSCGAATVRVQRDDGKGRTVEVLQCGDPANCVAARQRSLLHFCQTLELEGFGDKVVEILLDQGLADHPADLFLLTSADLVALPRFGEQTAANLLAQLDRARHLKLPMFLVSLGIASLGKQTAQLLATRGDLAAIRAMTADEIAKLHSLGDKSGESICNGLRDKAALIDALLHHVTIVAGQTETAAGNGPMLGQIVVFTGALQRMGRRDAQKLVVRLGGHAGDSVSAETTILVVGGDELQAAVPSSKLKKAMKLRDNGQNLQITSEAAFFEQLGGAA